jgi:hypothetical protein
LKAQTRERKMTMFKPRLTYKEFVAALTKGIDEAIDTYDNDYEGIGQCIQDAAIKKENALANFYSYPTDYSYLTMRITKEVYEILIT